ncbi:hypothetical protein HOH11_00345 [Candidatus Woesearchaeota archaeon]|jgi:hypothetical protein|nr:hypothetical protein [Candidatus Woesearchaeota archaeon]MBT6023042.1 hypothetical protein [Candidatus Woesearchaeota archaeon]
MIRIKSKKGEGEIQTLMYLFFAVLFIIIGLISVKSYLINVAINKDLQLSNLDFGVIGNRLIASDNCLAERSEITVDWSDKPINFVQIGNVRKERITESVIGPCLKGFDKIDICTDPKYTSKASCESEGEDWEEQKTIQKYSVTFYELVEETEEGEKWRRTIIDKTYGTLDCARSRRKGEFLINIIDDQTTKLGVFKLCIA